MKLSSVTLKLALALALGSSKVLADDTVVSPRQKPTPMNILQEEKLHNESKLASLGMVQPLIVNGVEVNPPGKYPYMTYAYGCGASLVAPNVLLCAAHCAGFISQVQIGRHDRSDPTEAYETFSIAEEVPHPDYNSNTMSNDFMMMRLDGESAYGTVALDTGDIPLNNGEDLIVMGWGTTASGGSSSNVLMEVEVDAWTNSACNQAYGNIDDSMLCAARSSNGLNYDSCQGDSGGPIIDKATGKQVGVVSWGYGCANPNYPGVYARVSHQIEWIQSYIDMWSSGNPFPTKAPVVAPTYGNCMNDPNFVDSYGDDCSWYENNAEPGCPNWSDCCDAGNGTPGEACCYCGGGIPLSDPPVPSPTGGSVCDGITDKQTCNQTEGCGYNSFDNECRIALTAEECSAYDGKMRKCKKNGCKWRNSTSKCESRWA